MSDGNKLFVVIVIIIIAVMLVVKNHSNKNENKYTPESQNEIIEKDDSDEEILEGKKIEYNETVLAEEINTIQEEVKISDFRISSVDDKTVFFNFDIENLGVKTKYVLVKIIFYDSDGKEIGRTEYANSNFLSNTKESTEYSTVIEGGKIEKAKVEMDVEDYKDIESDADQHETNGGVPTTSTSTENQ